LGVREDFFGVELHLTQKKGRCGNGQPDGLRDRSTHTLELQARGVPISVALGLALAMHIG
jgi:hypothetical protein